MEPTRYWLIFILFATSGALGSDLVPNTTPPAASAPAKPPRTAEGAITPWDPGNTPRQNQFLERAKDKNIQLVFLGDSITECWTWEEENRGKTVWDEYYATKYDAANFGVSGEHTEHVLGRITHGILDGLHPKVVVLLIGTNNIHRFPEEKPEWVAAGIKKIVDTVYAKIPETKVLLLGIFPRDARDSVHRHTVEAINAIISKFDDGVKTRYLDLTAQLTDATGEISKEVMPDGLHPSTKGYRIWAESMQPLLNEMMKQ